MMAILLALFWSGLVIWRIRLLARFFQLEEYKTGRFLRWVFAQRERYMPLRFVIGGLAGLALAVVLLAFDVEAAIVYLLVWVTAGAIIVWPEPAKEIKKRFVATQRAKRLLGGAFLMAALSNLVPTILFVENDDVGLFVVGLIGLVVYWLAPVALPIGNGVMYPIEETLRWGFRTKARRRLQQAGPTVIGVTGSYGKTSTKDYIAHILAGRFKVLATPKSYNTVMGICITINNDLEPTAGYQYFVIEMGAYIRGEIRRLCKLTHPQIGVVTAVGPQHLERFGSIENIVEAKYEIIEGLPADGVGVFNNDDPRVRQMAERGYPQTIYTVSCVDDPGERPRLTAKNIRHAVDGLTFEVVDRQTGDERVFNTQLVGLHNVTNILLAATVARYLDMPLNEIAMRVASLAPPEHRLKRTTLSNGIVVLDDAYNTNPVGAVSAMQVLNLHQEGRRVLITPGMVELGALQDQENEKLGRIATQYCTDIVLVGEDRTLPIQRGVRATDFDLDHLLVMDTVQQAIEWYQRELKSGDAILFLNDLSDNYLL